jgi:hypothetical protein
LGGNSLMECGVFGRRAARAAAEYVNTFDNWKLWLFYLLFRNGEFDSFPLWYFSKI